MMGPVQSSQYKLANMRRWIENKEAGLSFSQSLIKPVGLALNEKFSNGRSGRSILHGPVPEIRQGGLDGGFLTEREFMAAAARANSYTWQQGASLSQGYMTSFTALPPVAVGMGMGEVILGGKKR
ncbi:hypothetical protein [Chitinimonas lacunae]|uniref:Uncharacterized protein n=1 Tax=Chitinimonas lacunae TaxID=1963018 RepID=A0ABV8MNB2_9NEIS